MRGETWARRQGSTLDEWHALIDEQRLITVCGTTLDGPVERRTEPPGFRDPACAQCYTRATDLVGVEELDRDARELRRRGDVVVR